MWQRAVKGKGPKKYYNRIGPKITACTAPEGGWPEQGLKILAGGGKKAATGISRKKKVETIGRPRS